MHHSSVFGLLLYVFHFASTTATIAVDLKTAASYAIMAGSTIANTGLTVVNGDLGLFPGTAVTGFPPGLVSQGFSQHIANIQAHQAKTDLIAAMLATSLLTTGVVWIGDTIDVGGTTMYPGIYSITTTLGVLIGDLTLDANGDTNALFIFKMVYSPFIPTTCM